MVAVAPALSVFVAEPMESSSLVVTWLCSGEACLSLFAEVVMPIGEQQSGWLLAEPSNVGKLTGGWRGWGWLCWCSHCLSARPASLLPLPDVASCGPVQTVEGLLLTF